MAQGVTREIVRNWLCPLVEPNEVMAPEAQMDGSFLGNEDKPKPTSTPQETPNQPPMPTEPGET